MTKSYTYCKYLPFQNFVMYYNADVDECLSSNGGCGQACTNTDGSFQCSCDEGYILAADNLECDGKDYT